MEKFVVKISIRYFLYGYVFHQITYKPIGKKRKS